MSYHMGARYPYSSTTTQLDQMIGTDDFTVSRRVIHCLEECLENKAAMDTYFDNNERLSTEQERQCRSTGASAGARF